MESEEKWVKFSEIVNQNLQNELENKWFEKRRTQKWLNISWQKMQKAIIHAAYETIPFTKVKKKSIINNTEYTETKLKYFKVNKMLLKTIAKFKKFHRNNSMAEIVYLQRELIFDLENRYKLLFEKSLIQELKLSQSNNEIFLEKLRKIQKIAQVILVNEENKIKELRIKELADQRCTYLDSNKKNMISSILERERKTIKIDRIIVDNELLTEGTKVNKATADHFSKITNIDRRELTHEIEEEWKAYYEPIAEINENWYNELLTKPTLEEWYQIISSMKNGSAPGRSGVSYEMIKHLDGIATELLLEIIDACIKTSSIPTQWNQGVIYPIPKPGDWNLDLSKTRPITLLETPRKMLTKLLNDRLAKIFVRYNVLKNHNYAGLPGNSTQEPIHILNAVIEDAREKNKDLWIFFQDMSKAYDSVNRELLDKALKRLKIPEEFRMLIKRMFHGRKNRVITDFGFTDEYEMKNGIDQGETISPLLWVIYYDPLFKRIKDQKNLGYKISHTWKPDLRVEKSNKLEQLVQFLTYMNDTTWVADNKESLKKMLDISDSFYRYNGISINKKKSELLVISSKKRKKDNSENIEKPKIELVQNGEVVVVEAQPNKSIRFLGIWVSDKNNKRFIQEQIKNEILTMELIMRYKKVTDKQVTYIFNNVIAPRIEYRSQLQLFSEKELENLSTNARRLLRNKIGMANTAPNSILYHSELYNLTNIWQRQAQHHIPNLVYRLNDKGNLGKITEIRARSLQKMLGIGHNIFERWDDTEIKKFKNNLIGQILCVSKIMNIQFKKRGLVNHTYRKTVKGFHS